MEEFGELHKRAFIARYKGAAQSDAGAGFPLRLGDGTERQGGERAREEQRARDSAWRAPRRVTRNG